MTHTLVGVCMGNAFLRRRLGREAVPALAIASNLPDIDAVVHLSFDARALLLRRTFGHSIFLLPLWSAGLALLLRRFTPRLGFSRLLAISLLGAAVHLVFDLINSFGVVLLWPLCDWRPELAITFILDFLLTGLLLLPLLLCAPARFRGRLAGLSRASLAAVFVYLLVCAGSRALAEGALAAGVANRPASFSYIFPEPLGPHRFRGVVRDGDTYRLYLVHSFSGRLDEAAPVRTQTDDPRVQAVQRTSLGQRLGAFFKAPVWSVRETPGGGAQVSVYDLRFQTLVLRRQPIFGYAFRVDGNGRVTYTP